MYDVSIWFCGLLYMKPNIMLLMIFHTFIFRHTPFN